MKYTRLIILLFSVFYFVNLQTASAVESTGDDLVLSDWTASLGGGAMFYEGDEEFYPTQIYELKAGYDLNPRWTVEGNLGYLPHLNRRHGIKDAAATDSWGLRAGADLLYHLNDIGEDKFDPFLAATAGVGYISARLADNGHFDTFAGVGAGANYYFQPQWYARGDYRLLMVGHDTEVNHELLVSIGHRFRAGSDAYGRGAGVLDDAYAVSGLKPIYYDYDSAQLKEEAQQRLRENAKWIQENPEAKILLEGHCDERGTNEYNLALGERRARSAHDYLTNLGVSASRINTVSYGEERPAVAESNEAAWAKNRRVECKVLK